MNECVCGIKIRNENKLCRSCHDKKRRKYAGKAGTSIHNRWRFMLRRCYDEKDPRFYQYGGRGIKVCNRWLDFNNYYADLGDIPFEGAQIDRIDPDGNYEPNNVRWVSRSDNMLNTRRSKVNRDKYKMVRLDKLCKDCSKII